MCYQSFDGLSASLLYFFGVLHTSIGIIAFCGNLMVFMVIYNTYSLRNRSSVSLVSLAMTDFLVGCVLQPMHILQFFYKDYRSKCTFNAFRRMLSIFIAVASFSSIALISYDRYINLSKPFEYHRHMRRRKIITLVALCWLVPASVPFLRFVGRNETVLAAVISTYVFSNFAVTFVSYVCIITIIRKRQEELARGDNKTQIRSQSARIRQQIKAAKAIAVIIVCFFLATVPISVYNSLVAIEGFLLKTVSGFEGDTREIIYAVAVTFAMANSAINPIIYYVKIPDYKKNVLRLFRDKFSCS